MANKACRQLAAAGQQCPWGWTFSNTRVLRVYATRDLHTTHGRLAAPSATLLTLLVGRAALLPSVPPGTVVQVPRSSSSTSTPQPAFRCVLREKWPRIALDLRHGLSHNTSAATYTAYATQHATQHVVVTHKQKAHPGYITMHDHETPQQQSGTVILTHSRQTKVRISRYMRVKERADRQRKDESCRSYV